MDALLAIEPDGKNYGWWRPDGDGEYLSWRATMERLRTLPQDDDIASNQKVDNVVVHAATKTASRLLERCPELRNVVHGDLANNILFDEGTPTAVIDWLHSMYGDPIFDVAELSSHVTEINYASIFKARYASTPELSNDFDARLLCYQILITISDVCYYARIGAQRYDAKIETLNQYVEQAINL